MSHSDDRLEHRVRTFYSEQGMTPHRSAELLRRLDHVRTRSRNKPSFGRDRAGRIGFVAVPLLALLLGAVFGAGAVVRQHNARTIATEIALNHRKQLDVDVAAPRIEALQAAMPKLDFTLATAERPEVEGLSLLGARYCSIDQEIAAQLRLLDRQGRTYTLYQLRLPDLALPSERTFRVRTERPSEPAVEVILWRQGGLLMGLASSDQG